MSPVARLRLKLLGGYEARVAEGPVIGIAAKKTRALLAYLALAGGRRYRRDKLADLLWSDRGDKQARDSLRQALVELRDALADIRPAPLTTDHDLVSVDPAAVEVDALQFERLAAHDSADELRHAVALYDGDLLDGLDARDPAFDDWLRDERQRYRELAVTVLKKLLTHETGATAMAVAQRLLALDPLQEEGHRALMRLHTEAGDIATALRQDDTCCGTLKRELDIAPSPETEALHRRIRDQSAARAGSDCGVRPATDSRQPPTASASKPSVAVLPFRNLSDDPEQRYFSDGITEDIITELSRFRELFVIARNSSFQFRDESVDLKGIGRDLGVGYVVEGSVRRAGNRIRVTTQLVEVATGAHLWAEHYDRDLQDIFAVQDEVTQTIVATLVGRLAASGADRAKRTPTQHWAAYDFFLHGRECVDRYDVDTAEPLLQRATELDPGFAQAHAMLARLYVFRFFSNGRPGLLSDALAHANRAVSLDEHDARCHWALATVYMFMNRLDLAGVHYRKAVALNPSDTDATSGYAHWLARMGRTSEALEKLDIAVQRDPFAPDWYWELRAVPLLQEKRYEEFLEGSKHISRRQVWHYPYQAIAYAHMGRIEEAKAAAAEVLRLKPDFSAKWIVAMEPYKNPADLEHLLDGLRKAGLPE
jgi:TolB-like protein